MFITITDKKRIQAINVAAISRMEYSVGKNEDGSVRVGSLTICVNDGGKVSTFTLKRQAAQAAWNLMQKAGLILGGPTIPDASSQGIDQALPPAQP